MRDSYSLYETKSKLSAIIRRVREGHRVVVTVHGEPVAEIRPIAETPEGISARMDQLAEQGILRRPAAPRNVWRAVARRPGALERFLADRDG
ncbi:MAG TPA: type II toxin-antitoxin system prevent-host-death family antitoxin [Gemmatimonadaceae bacterium]|jgi:prevent-host-death family protein|nr:type II toxin-antitoxin system prevent-host-death family antitoxin [Gemmatimonadaceae bacterium]